MQRVVVIALALLLVGCGGGGGGEAHVARVSFGDLGPDRLGFGNQSSVVVRDDLYLYDLIRVLRHELMHVAGMNGHPATTGICIANPDAAFWPDEPCPSDIELMTSLLPEQPIQLVVVEPLLMGPTLEAVDTWNFALGWIAFVVEPEV